MFVTTNGVLVSPLSGPVLTWPVVCVVLLTWAVLCVVLLTWAVLCVVLLTWAVLCVVPPLLLKVLPNVEPRYVDTGTELLAATAVVDVVVVKGIVVINESVVVAAATVMANGIQKLHHLLVHQLLF